MAATLSVEKPKKGQIGIGMEGSLARWYAKTTGTNLEPFRSLARSLAGQFAGAANVLEVAPGPGYLAIELAKQGRFHVMGLDISKTFVEIATANAKATGTDVEFHQGNASEMPFESGSFDLIVCRAAFKNFSDPVGAIEEMYRVLKCDGTAMILDSRPDVSPAEIATEVEEMNLNWLNALIARSTLRWLTRRAHSKDAFARMAAQTSFKSCTFKEVSIGLEITLTKQH